MHKKLIPIAEHLICAVEEQMEDLESACTQELGEVIDMIKDLAEAEYYAKISKAMDEAEYGEDYDYMGAYDDRERKGRNITFTGEEQPRAKLTKKAVPFGVIGIIYEARPNVSFDVFSLCFKTANVCVLKGGTDAYNSNFAIVNLIKEVLREHNLDENMVHLLPAGREATGELLSAVGYIDLIIPRGSAGLIKYVRENSQVPVIETGAGVVHCYFDKDGDLEKGKAIIENAKTRRVSVCNALDCLVIHKDRLGDLAAICSGLIKEKNVVIEADESAYNALNGNYPAELLTTVNEESFGKEFMSHRMSIKTADSLKDAIDHINTYSSKHSESIVTENEESAAAFLKEVDASCVYHNAPTSFTDGGQFGMGAEIGISTQKLHARGPMALPELCTYKWLIVGNGQTRS